MDGLTLTPKSTIAGLSTAGGATAAEARIKQLQTLKKTLTQRAVDRNLPVNRETFKLLLEEELKKIAAQRQSPAKLQNAPTPPNLLPPLSAEERQNAINKKAKLEPFPFAGKPLSPLAPLPPLMQSRREKIAEDVKALSSKYGVDPLLVDAVIQQESGYQPAVVSKSGAIGLMQLMPKTAEGLGVKDPYDPLQNLEGGIKYLAQQLDRFGGNVSLALAAYNAGPGAVSKYGGIPPYNETQNYVRKIMKNYLSKKYQ